MTKGELRDPRKFWRASATNMPASRQLHSLHFGYCPRNDITEPAKVQDVHRSIVEDVAQL
jgi:hypothetical protein